MEDKRQKLQNFFEYLIKKIDILLAGVKKC